MSFGKKLKDQLIQYGITDPDGFSGCTEDEIAKAMSAQGVTFLPRLYRELLLEIGYYAGNRLFQGEDYTCTDLLWLKEVALKLLAGIREPFELPEDAFVFLMHQGCIFWYFHTKDHEEDPPVFVFSDKPREGEIAFQHLSELFNGAVSYIVEKYGKKP